MIGRFAGSGAFVEVNRLRLAQVAVAGALILAAIAAKYVTGLPEPVVIGLSGASLAITGFPIIAGAVRGLARGKTNVDELVAIAIVASLILGEWISAAVVSFIMVLGGLIEHATASRARRHIEALLTSAPRHAWRVEPDGAVRSVSMDALSPGDILLVRPGDVIAADGSVLQGSSTVDESMFTGESVPVAKSAGDLVYAGTINGAGSLRVRVDRVGPESTQGKVLRLVREAEQHRAPIVRAAEAYARWFTPLILALAAVVGLATGDARRAVTMLIVGCPCAFVLATPTAVVAALGRASRRGILIKGGKYLEACAKVDVVALDKTGTLTTDRCRVRQVVPFDELSVERLLHEAARLEMASEHPLARAIVRKAQQLPLGRPKAANVRRQPGLGLSETEAATPWHIGSRRFVQQQGVLLDLQALAASEALQRDGCSVLFVAEGDRLRGLLAVEDDIRPEAPTVIQRLRRSGYRDILLLTGDSPGAALRTAAALGLSPEAVLPELTPEQKYGQIQALQRAGRCICYVGDGTNDAPALALADVGISIGSRENTVALETAHMVLLRDGLSGLPFLMHLSKATVRTINQNLVLLGLLANALMLALSATGWLTPILGAIGHNIGSVSVVLNSARLLRLREPT